MFHDPFALEPVCDVTEHVSSPFLCEFLRKQIIFRVKFHLSFLMFLDFVCDASFLIALLAPGV